MSIDQTKDGECKSLYPDINRYLDDIIIDCKDRDGNLVKKSLTDADGLSRIEFFKTLDSENRKEVINHLFCILCEIYESLSESNIINQYLFIDMLSQFLKSCGDYYNIIREKDNTDENGNEKG